MPARSRQALPPITPRFMPPRNRFKSTPTTMTHHPTLTVRPTITRTHLFTPRPSRVQALSKILRLKMEIGLGRGRTRRSIRIATKPFPTPCPPVASMIRVAASAYPTRATTEAVHDLRPQKSTAAPIARPNLPGNTTLRAIYSLTVKRSLLSAKPASLVSADSTT